MSERGQMSGHVSASGSLLQVRALSTVRCRGWRHVSTEPLVDVWVDYLRRAARQGHARTRTLGRRSANSAAWRRRPMALGEQLAAWRSRSVARRISEVTPSRTRLVLSMGDRLRADIPSRLLTSKLGQLALRLDGVAKSSISALLG